MSDDKSTPIMTKQEALELAKQLATPIDFDQLIKDGIIEKKGAWYQVLDMERLPKHAKKQITEFTQDGKVKFSLATKSAQKLVDKLSK
ncbi:MAG: hypothetical protein OQJ89_00395 [Kangiellaceae bacterium]|nr:hypothetical protein [Kangiellaceae bacterium]MCW8998850.1 hypothetical protein [Kangiellaceae bacterium]MCW9015398.1 hypothetical protein [Kangiellaceae bacterium]